MTTQQVERFNVERINTGDAQCGLATEFNKKHINQSIRDNRRINNDETAPETRINCEKSVQEWFKNQQK
jgi:hypothetical protein